MTSKAQRRRANKRRLAAVSRPGEPRAEQPARQPDGRIRPVDPRKVVLEARMKRSGINDKVEANQPICGTDIGLCIYALTSGDERRVLSETWFAISAAHRNYRMLYVGQTGDPKCAAITMVSEPVETNQSFLVDVRTADERIKSAKASWQEWSKKIRGLPSPPLVWAVEGALNGFLGEGALWRDAAPTVNGKIAVMALKLLSGVSKG